MSYELVPAVHLPERMKPLFAAYQEWLLVNDPMLQKCLDVQGYDSELGHLEEKYGLPDGALYILRVDGEDAGCIGLRRLDAENGEAKRLFLYPQYRGLGYGRILMEQVLKEAKIRGYRAVYLDTIPIMTGGCKLYRRMGFVETERYYDNPVPYAIFMRKDLV